MKILATVRVGCPSCGADPDLSELSKSAATTGMVECQRCGKAQTIQQWCRVVAIPAVQPD